MNLRTALLGLLGLTALQANVARAAVVADSSAEFSGVQGQNGWTNGYRNYTVDGGGDDYNPDGGFIAFAGGDGQGAWDGSSQVWTGSAWDLNTEAAGPWTFMSSESLHPNGENSAPNEEHWVIRRWAATELAKETALAITWNTRKENTGGGNGVTGGVWVNGKKADSAVIGGTDGTGVTRTIYVNVKPTDRVDLVLSPAGTDGQRNDGADGTFNWMRIDDALPEFARQPDGTLFIPAGAPDTDGDGLPDVWEKAYAGNDLSKLNATGDLDSDGIKDKDEFTKGTDPSNPDTDGDGLKDGVETGTGTFVDANNTGTDPRNPDTDGDGRKDGEEVKGTPKSNPLLADTDGDTFTDGQEVASGHDPNDPNHNPNTTVIANSSSEFSGVQGQDGWHYGYRNFSADGGDPNTYNPATAFIEFAGGDGQGDWDGSSQFWTGSQWDLQTAATGPWDELGPQNTHPNGPSPVHWTIRRWQAAELAKKSAVALRWHTHKANTGCGNGVTGGVFVNGVLIDRSTIAFNDGAGVTRTVYANLAPTDVVDLILSPRGTDNADADGCDGTVNWLQVDSVIPPNPVQPDGTVFIPVGAGDSDADGIPDAWEKIFFAGDLTKLSAVGDFDGDGLKDVDEYNRDSDPTKADTDGDGLSDKVETGTGVFVSATDTGSNPRKADTDGDGISDANEVNAAVATNPNKVDTDGDGFTDPDEIAEGTDPTDKNSNILAGVIANSIAEFSGTQGKDGWYNGYRNYTADGGGTDYDANIAFIPYAGDAAAGPWDGTTQLWTGSSWDLETAAAGPWTYQAPEGIHPNGVNSAPNEEHWAIRRWVATELTKETPVALVWRVRKDNANGAGVTGSLHVNGRQVDFATIAGNNTTNPKRKYYVNLKKGDIVDLALTPEGPGGDRADGSDGSVTWLWVDTALPKEPRQPDGSLFIPSTAVGVDTDNDGLLDFWERIYATDLATFSGDGDNDGDGVKNKDEFTHDSNPLLADTDNDGLRDGGEIAAGSNPRKADTDGDGLSDGAEVNGSPATSPVNPDTDGDGFSDGSEVASGHNPIDPNHNPNTTKIADSAAEFSGTQGKDGWYYGYRVVPGSAPANYDAVADVKIFPGGENGEAWDGVNQFWSGTQWDVNTAAAAPWTEIGPQNVHPNGPSPVHWCVRRWAATELAGAKPLALRWHTRKANLGGGNGVTGALYINGKLADKAVIAFNDGTGVTRTFYALVNPTDVVDLILSPTGTDGGNADGADGSANWLVVDTAIPPNPTQPDGTPFNPGGEVVRPDITGFSANGGNLTLTWKSAAGARYTVQSSTDLRTFNNVLTGVVSAGATTSQAVPVGAGNAFYRVLVE